MELARRVLAESLWLVVGVLAGIGLIFLIVAVYTRALIFRIDY